MRLPGGSGAKCAKPQTALARQSNDSALRRRDFLFTLFPGSVENSLHAKKKRFVVAD